MKRYHVGIHGEMMEDDAGSVVWYVDHLAEVERLQNDFDVVLQMLTLEYQRECPGEEVPNWITMAYAVAEVAAEAAGGNDES